MASVVYVHGIGQQGLGERSLLTRWEAAFVDGLTWHADTTRSATSAGGAAIGPALEVAMAFYGDVFGPAGSFLSVGDPMLGTDDVVALVKDLRPRFGDRVRNAVVHKGSTAHSVMPYLTDALTGSVIAEGLT